MFSLLAGAFLFAGSLDAQIVTNGTVGAATALTGPNFQIPSSLGTARGPNLFHSFQTFNINSGESATFSGPGSFANVFSRVTGGSPSSINGLLKCDIPGANFYFINPAGVLFGPNASVDVQGSFAVTTADYIRFADGGRFDARTPANDVLTVASPAAFGFLPPPAGQSPAGVTFNNCALQVPDGQTLTVAAGPVQAKNDPATAPNGTTIRARGGTLQVAAVASAGELPIDGLDTASFSALENITLSGNSIFSSGRSGASGRFLLRAQDLSLSDNAGIANNSLDSGIGGASEIDLRGTLSLASGGFITAASTGQANAGSLSISAQTLSMDGGVIWGTAAGSGAGASITINAPVVSLQNGAWISADAQDLGLGGTVAINAPTALLQDASYISADAYGPGAGGRVTVIAPVVSLENSATLSADTYGPAPAGAVTVNAQSVRVLSGAEISSDCRAGAAGPGGSVTLQAGDVQVDSAAISAGSDGTGTGGQVQISSQTLSVSGQNDVGWVSTIASGGGAAGEITITTGKLTLDPGGQITSDTFGAGRAGDITIQATDIVLNEGEIAATTSGGGAGGDVRITSDSLSLAGPASDARINTASLGSGDAGSIFITTGDLAANYGGVIISDALDAGRAGNITIQATDISLDQGIISAGTLGAGAGGDVRISSDTLSLTGAGEITTSTSMDGTGHAGNISITTGDMTLDQGALVFAAPLGVSGDGGDIQITAHNLSLLNGSGIGSTSFGVGVAGSIQLERIRSVPGGFQRHTCRYIWHEPGRGGRGHCDPGQGPGASRLGFHQHNHLRQRRRGQCEHHGCHDVAG